METRWRNQPVAGMTTAIVSMNAVESHWALVAGTANSRISRGIALTMMVSLRMTTKVASTSSRSTLVTLTPGAGGVAAELEPELDPEFAPELGPGTGSSRGGGGFRHGAVLTMWAGCVSHLQTGAAPRTHRCRAPTILTATR